MSEPLCNYLWCDRSDGKFEEEEIIVTLALPKTGEVRFLHTACARKYFLQKLCRRMADLN